MLGRIGLALGLWLELVLGLESWLELRVTVAVGVEQDRFTVRLFFLKNTVST